MKRLGCKVIMMLFISVSALAWTKPINISNTPMVSHHGAITVDREGRIHVAWEDGIRTDSCRIMYCYCKGDSWYSPTKIADVSMYSGVPDVVIDTLGNVHVAWTEYGAGEIYWSFFDGDSWSVPFNVSNKPYQDFRVRMEVDRQTNTIYMVWHEYSDFGDIWYSVYDGISWSTPRNITNDEPQSSDADIAIDSKGHLHIVWVNHGKYETDFDIYYSKYDGNSWSEPIKVSDLPGYSGYPRIAIDSKDYPYVVWEERYKGDYYPYYSFYKSNSWSDPYQISDKNSSRPVIAIDSHDKVHIAWTAHRPYKDIYYRFYNSNSWSSIINVSNSPRNAGTPIDLTIDNKNRLHLVWTEATTIDEADIYYSRDSIADVLEDSIPTRYGLNQNFPNPLLTETTIFYQLPKTSYVTVTIYDTLGREVKRFDLGLQPAGYYDFLLDFEEMGAGVYFYRLVADGFTATGKMVMFGKERG